MNVEKYLSRIGLDRIGAVADIYNLKLLQRQHLVNVPFENLDIHWRRPIRLDTGAFYRKIVDENRGGFCYELNGLFNELLRDRGYETRILSARVADRNGVYGPEYDHLAILVLIGEMQYLADVGFGAFTAEPLELALGKEQEDAAGMFVVREYRDDYLEVARKENGVWQGEYIFRPLGRALPEFGPMCEYQQTSPDSHFTEGKLCSVMTIEGRKTLTDEKFIVTSGGERTE